MAVKAGGNEVGDGTPVTAGKTLLNDSLKAVVNLVYNVDLKEGYEAARLVQSTQGRAQACKQPVT